jgi:hypothetical protein
MTTEQLIEHHRTHAEVLLKEIDEHLNKRGRKVGTEQGNAASVATSHATLALFYQRERDRSPSH